MKWVKKILFDPGRVFAGFYLSPDPKVPPTRCVASSSGSAGAVTAVFTFFTSLAG